MLVTSYGIAGLTFLEVCHYLEDLGIDHYRMLAKSKLVEGVTNLGTIIVFKSKASFIAKLENLEISKRDCCALVVDTRQALDPTNLVPLGYTSKTFSRLTKEDLFDSLNKPKQPFNFYEGKEPSVFSDLVLKYKSDSIVSFIQTSFYKIKDIDKRKRVVDLATSYILGKISLDKFKDYSLSFVDSTETSSVLKHLEDPKCIKLRRAIKEVGEMNNKRLEKIAKTHNISPFDIRYFLSKK